MRKYLAFLLLGILTLVGAGGAAAGAVQSQSGTALSQAVKNTLGASNYTEDLVEKTPQGNQQASLVFQAVMNNSTGALSGIPVDLKNEIAALASEDGLHVPVGELVTAMLRFGMKAYESGLLKLEPIQKTTGLTLVQEGKK